MNISALFRLMGGDGQELYDFIKNEHRELAIQDGLQQYDVNCHDVASKEKRPDKVIFVPTGENDPVTGQPKVETDTAAVARVPLAIQKYIINQKASFALGNGVILKPTDPESEVFKYVQKNWIENKTRYLIKKIAVKMMAETQAAVIFSGEKGKESLDDFKFRMKVVSPSEGSKLHPFFDDETGDMIAIGREYKLGKDEIYDLYAKTEGGKCEIRRYENGKPMLDASNNYVSIPLPYKDLPVIYWEQPRPECDDVQAAINELETGFSDFLTQQGYSADPILFGKGKTLSLPPKGQGGKFIEGSEDADLKFVTPDNATESRELQFSMLEKYIFTLSRSVLIDMETMKELGDVSGETLKRLLTDPLMEAEDKQQGDWGMGIQRMVNWLVKEWSELVIGGKRKDFRIDVLFTEFSTTSEMDRVELAVKANGGKPVVDLRGGIEIAGLVDDIENTFNNINSEENGGNSN